ncbi:MAG TPA: glucose 1-dehydrogenase [Xanthomonadales bacterium]|nr:glucose 1-dehydrogenase [Xanthomonadales bacterium]
MERTRTRAQVAIVTGGAQGIGRAIAESLLDTGWQVLVGDLDAEAGAECLREWRTDRAAFVRLDVAREASVRGCVRTCTAKFGRIDALVNNAGIPDPENAPVERLELRDWNRMIATDLTGPFLCVKHATAALRRARGAVVSIASTRALQSEPDTEAYAAAKGGLVALTHALAISLGPRVRVNCVSPGWIDTSEWKKRRRRKPARLTRADHARHPAGRVGTPRDVAALVRFLVSRESGFMTGAHVVVDGGMTRVMRYD